MIEDKIAEAEVSFFSNEGREPKAILVGPAVYEELKQIEYSDTEWFTFELTTYMGLKVGVVNDIEFDFLLC